VTNALNHKHGPAPYQINFTSAYADMVSATRGKLIDLDVLFDNPMMLSKYKKNRPTGHNTEIDLFGLKWDKSGEDGGDIGMPMDPPIVSDEVKPDGSYNHYVMPVPDLAFAHLQAKKLQDDDGGHFRMFGITFGLYERAWGLRGMENVLMDFLCEPAFIEHLLEQITDHHLALLDGVLNFDFEALYFGDDWGAQNGLIMGAETWRKFIRPCMSKIIAKAKSKDRYVVLHSCGNNWDIIGDWIDMGVDCYNTVQPEIYDLIKLKQEYGKYISFYGAISNQQFLPYATAKEVKAHCLEVLKIMGSGGGYILSPTHSITPDIPIENAFAIIEAAKEYNESL